MAARPLKAADNELSDFGGLWHGGCGETIIEATHSFDDLDGPVAELGEGVTQAGTVVDAVGEQVDRWRSQGKRWIAA
jgi:hypothetical protein